MKVQSKRISWAALCPWACFVAMVCFSPSAQAMKVAANVNLPVVAGSTSDNFTSNVGADVLFYADPLLDPKVDNFVKIGYESLTLRADTLSSFRVLPALVGLELPGQVFSDFKVRFGAGIGAAFTYFYTANISTTHMVPYGAAELRPSLEYDVTKEWAITGEMPILYVFNGHPISLITYAIGVQFQFGQGDPNENHSYRRN